MRKNINKLVAVAIGISVVSGGFVQAFADDANQSTNVTVNQSSNNYIYVQSGAAQKPLFTLQNAIDAAISNSATLELDDKTISYQYKFNDLNEDIDDANNNIDDDKKDLDQDTSKNKLNQLKQQKDFDKDKLIQKTTTAYNNIVTSQMKINKAAKLIALKNKEISDGKLKQSLGLLTAVDLSNIELQLQNLQKQQTLSMNTLKNAQDSFKVLTGKDVSNYTLESDIKYEEFKINGSVDEYLDNVIDKYMKYSEEALKINKDYYSDKDHQVSDTDVKDAEEAAKNAVKPSRPAASDISAYESYVDSLNQYNATIGAYSTMLSKRLTYLNTKLGIYKQETGLDEARKSYKDSLKTLYTNLLDTEENINYLKKNIELSNKQLSNTKLKYDLGLITKSEYDNQIATSDDLDIQLRSSVDSYNNLRNQIEKPWLVFGGTSATS